jgi:hypothetical protein
VVTFVTTPRMTPVNNRRDQEYDCDNLENIPNSLIFE